MALTSPLSSKAGMRWLQGNDWFDVEDKTQYFPDWRTDIVGETAHSYAAHDESDDMNRC